MDLGGLGDGVSYRVPVITVSVIDLVAELEREATVAEINTAFSMAACGPLAGVLGYTNLPLVSSDFRGNSYSSIVDGLMSDLLCEERMVHVVGWYDNEWGYASRVGDLASIISECERSGCRPERIRIVERDQIEQAVYMASSDCNA